MYKNIKNYKVPVAVLSSFLIAFILQGILKLCGVFVFEKALDWELFKIIDNHLWLQIIYYSLIVFATMYCLSFSLTSRPYSKKWYHYIILAISSVGITVLRLLVSISYIVQIVIDLFIYIVVPIVINLTSDNEDRLLKKNVFNVVLTITIQCGLYFCYLGLTYWSCLLNSMLITTPLFTTASRQFLVRLEVYLGLVAFMLGMNLTIKKIKGDKMLLPVDIASEIAKQEAKLRRLENVLSKEDKKREIIINKINEVKAKIEEIKKAEVKEIVE